MNNNITVSHWKELSSKNYVGGLRTYKYEIVTKFGKKVVDVATKLPDYTTGSYVVLKPMLFDEKVYKVLEVRAA